MSRRRKTLRQGSHELVTPRIVQGTWGGHELRGGSTFVANCVRLQKAFRQSRGRARNAPIAALFAALEQKSRVLETMCPNKHKIVPLFIRLASHRSLWVRRPSTWQPTRDGADVQVRDLIAHLFERYPVPTFLRPRWSPLRMRDWTVVGWYLHVASGNSIRTAPGLPVALSRRAAHELMQAPPGLLPRQAIRFGQLRAVGASRSLAGQILRTRLATDFEHDDFWLPVFAKMATTPGFSHDQVRPLIEYLTYRRFLEPGGVRFAMKGRSIASLTRAMRRWRLADGEQRLVRDYCGHEGAPGGRNTWDTMRDVAPLQEQRGGEQWSLMEISTFFDLFEEGHTMRHCVATYARRCVAGDTSIWSLRSSRGGVETDRVTIRVDVAKRAIVEARSLANGAVSRGCFAVLEKWAGQNRLQLGAVTVG